MPKITEVTVSTGRVISHPHQSYANIRPMLSLKATVEDGDDVDSLAAMLQGRAERMLAFHVEAIMATLEAEYQTKCKRSEEEYERSKAERSARVTAPDLDDDGFEYDDDDDEDEDKED